MHYIPIAPDYSDIEEKIIWCEQNLLEARRISERSSLFVHDMLFDRSSDKENEEVLFQVMERYLKIYGEG